MLPCCVPYAPPPACDIIAGFMPLRMLCWCCIIAMRCCCCCCCCCMRCCCCICAYTPAIPCPPPAPFPPPNWFCATRASCMLSMRAPMGCPPPIIAPPPPPPACCMLAICCWRMFIIAFTCRTRSSVVFSNIARWYIALELYTIIALLPTPLCIICAVVYAPPACDGPDSMPRRSASGSNAFGGGGGGGGGGSGSSSVEDDDEDDDDDDEDEEDDDSGGGGGGGVGSR
mmetsp:Transcript_2504/g.6796  ORF Transcript_2504/g.6796 Transcript_2504/m.6796 type:complete len:228 (-) Transcript_2504:1085-1768(-)